MQTVVMPRKRHVSRNRTVIYISDYPVVMPRKRHVSRNVFPRRCHTHPLSHASQEACE